MLLAGLLIKATVITSLEAQWSVSINGGIEVPVSGEFHTGPDFDVFPLLDSTLQGALPTLVGAPVSSVTTDVDSKDFDDIYDNFTTFGLDFGYQLTESSKVYVGFSITSGDADKLTVGTVAPGVLDLELQGQFGDYDEYSVFIGYQKMFNMEGKWRPNFSFETGVSFVDAIGASFSVPAVQSLGLPNTFVTGETLDVEFYDDSTVFFAGVNIGIGYYPNENWYVGAMTGLYWQSELDDDDTTLGAVGLGGLNDGEGLTVVPFRIFASYSF